MSRFSAPEVTSFAGGFSSIAASLTLTEIGAVFGIGTALLTFVLNVVYMYRKDKREQQHEEREQRESDAALAKWGGGE